MAIYWPLYNNPRGAFWESEYISQPNSCDMKPKIKITFADFWPEWNIEDFITPILKKHYDVVIDKKSPDVVFHSIFNRMQETPKYKAKKILILAENWRPKQFNSDFSISFDPYTETNFRLPLWQMYWLLRPSLMDRLFERRRVENFERFAAFTVSNGSNMLRNNHFDILSQYKKVHAYGKVRMNTFELQRAAERNPFDSSGIGPKYWRDVKDEFFLKHNHKFMMAYENTSYPGYCTEKLMDAFLAGSIPIYWGCSKIHEDWNERAFINVMKHSNWLDLVKTADTEISFFEEIYEQPVFTDEQKTRHLENLNNFEEWLMKIIKA